MERTEAVNVQKNIAGVAQGGFMMTYRTCRHETTSSFGEIEICRSKRKLSAATSNNFQSDTNSGS